MENQRQILMIEDDETIAFGIKLFLEKKSFSIISVGTLQAAKKVLGTTQQIDLILLDLNLPDGTGYDLCQWIKNKKDIPIIFLTVRDEEQDMIKGLDMGADDYIVKPFQLSVLFSRINAVLRRVQPQQQNTPILCCGNIQLDTTKTKVFLENEEVALTAREYKLLNILLKNKQQTLTRQVLLDKLWDVDGDFVNDNTLTVTMKRLREKLNNPASIITIRGIGYRLEDTDE
ncbi:MAG: response regulator transcription factor [Cellulosilyticaceae bacterium]